MTLHSAVFVHPQIDSVTALREVRLLLVETQSRCESPPLLGYDYINALHQFAATSPFCPCDTAISVQAVSDRKQHPLGEV